MQPALDVTLAFMRDAHAGQVDKIGEPYHRHPERVLGHLERMFPDATEVERRAALLHDVLEDTDYSGDDLIRLGYSVEVVSVVRELTRDKEDGRSYEDWIEDLAARGTRAALRVKLADNADNSDPARLRRLPPDRAEPLRQRYATARRTLERALDGRFGA